MVSFASSKYQVAKVSPGGSFAPFTPLVGHESVNEGSEGSESISILGFRVPTICGGKNFDDHI